MRKYNNKINLFIFSFILYLRLFLVMGVAWSMEVISLMSNSPIFLLTDICNTLQGVFIFILFVMTRRVLRLIKERFVFIRIQFSSYLITSYVFI